MSEVSAATGGVDAAGGEATCVPGDAESLRRHLAWLYGPDGVYPGNMPCRCEHGFVPLGIVNGVNAGMGWVRTTTHPNCHHHGTKTKRAAARGSEP